MTFQSRLKLAREGAGLTQAGLAELLGVNAITTHLWESKRLPRTPRDQTMLARLADVVGVRVEWLLTGHGPRLRPRKRKAVAS